MKKRALFGGSFDPIHSGHIAMALQLAAALELDEVLLMPTFVPPHKIREQMAPAGHRLAMCRLAAEPYPVLTVSNRELQRGGASFTADTLRALAADDPDTRWYLFTGADMFCTLRTWYHFDEIARTAVLCKVPRGDIGVGKLRTYAASLEALGAVCYVDERPVMPVSSTAIRRLAAEGRPLGGLVPPAVEQYIRQHRLYRQEETMDHRTQNEQFKAILRTRLSERRYHHSLCVADEAARLAGRYGADPEQAYTAGLLHDIMKDTDRNAQLQILEDFGILLSEVERAAPKLWHAMSGAAFIRNILHVEDEAIITAVRYHTTGRAGMSRLEQVLFVADFTSADRDYPDVAEIRRLADVSLEAAMEYGIVYTVRELLDRRAAVHPDTIAAYNALVLAAPAAGN